MILRKEGVKNIRNLRVQLHRHHAQASMEYLIVVGVAFLVMLPAIYFFFTFSKESGQEIATSQLDAVGREMVQTAETLLYSGPGSKTTMKVSIPEGVFGASIVDRREIVFNVSTSAGNSELLFFSRVNLTAQGCGPLGQCDLQGISTPGAKQIRLTALNTSVLVEQVG
jgi:hypothetical protein